MAMLTEARQLVEKVATGNRILAKSGLPGAIAMWHYYEEQVRP